MGLSFLGHIGMLAWLGFASDSYFLPMIAVQPGHASIQLQASIESAPGREPPVEPISFLLETDVPPVDPPSLEPCALTDSGKRFQNTPQAPAHEKTDDKKWESGMQIATTPVGELMALSQPIKRSEPPVAAASNPDDRPPPLAKRQRERMPVFEVRVDGVAKESSAASMPSPASRASEGAESIPSPTYNPSPRYPHEAITARQTGKATLRIEIAPDGTVVKATVIRTSGTASLDQAALDAIRRWKFNADKTGSTRNRVIGKTFRFKIDVRGRPRS